VGGSCSKEEGENQRKKIVSDEEGTKVEQ